jgi:hypothetical protein
VRKLSKASSAGPTPANKEQRYLELQELLVTVGLGLFVVGYIPAGIWAQQGVSVGNYVQYSWLWLLFGIFQSAGLVTFTFADIDINAFAKRHKGRTGIFASIFLSFNAAAVYALLISGDGWSEFAGSALVLPMLPFVYMFVFFSPVLGMQDGYPRFSVLVVMALILNWFAYGVYLLVPGVSPDADAIYRVAGIGVFLETFLITFYYQQQSRNNSRTIALNATIYAYLLANGVTDLLSRILMACPYGIPSAVPNWLFG